MLSEGCEGYRASYVIWGASGWIKDRFSTAYEWRERTDYSNVHAWQENRDTLSRELETKKQIED